MSNVMLHFNVEQSILKPNSILIKKLDTSSENTLRNFSTSESRFASAAGKYHVHLWTFERILSFSLLGLIPSIFFFESKELESAMATCVSLHAYLGMDSILTDYAATRGTIKAKITKGISILLGVAMLAGLLNIIHNDIGLAELLRMIWRLGKEEGDEQQPAIKHPKFDE
ncbi:succinate dehydrogenase [ubiquinone] cytochrome b small subunit A, mitochondrial-like isoform X2 [Nilaparvata lugens]|nr:succinate dehydrogenase [ubiquinone] cytochrome b small subunit A, mitochondrial-like isoform X2 [Nilaparvata lugens]